MYMQMHADTFHKRIHAHTETEMHAWMDAHVMQVDSYIIEVALKDDCENEFHLRLQS